MEQKDRKTPQFSLCGLNCSLCPRYQYDGVSKCPGCGGKGFYLKHPSCAVMTCNKKHDNVEFCFLCSAYPCSKYQKSSQNDSFITYKKVLADFEKVKTCGIAQYTNELAYKTSFLEYLLANCNNGRNKSFYCMAVNLLELDDLIAIEKEIKNNTALLSKNPKEKAAYVTDLFYEKAKNRNIDLKLRKQ